MSDSLTILTGASRGLGLAMAHELCSPGARLLCISRGRSDALATRAVQVGCQLEQWQADLSEPAAVANRLQQWLTDQGPESLRSASLINNAGVISALRPLSQNDGAGRSEVAKALRVGLEAPLLLSAAFLSATDGWTGVERKLLNISSGLGRRAMAASAAYCAAKAGMDHFSRCLALEEAHKPQGARICSLAPGVIDTDMQTQLRSASAQDFPDQPGFAALHAKDMLSSPQQCARAVLAYLARPDFGSAPVADVRGANP